MFVATVINFVASSLNTGNHISEFIAFTQKAFIDIDYPLSEKPQLVNNALRKADIVTLWTAIIPVSSNLSLRIPCQLVYAR